MSVSVSVLQVACIVEDPLAHNVDCVPVYRYPSLSKSALVDLFNSFDADGSGDIDVKEFTMVRP